MQTPKCYLASPFFNDEQVALVAILEGAIKASGWRMFSPRKGENAKVMNDIIARRREHLYSRNYKLAAPSYPEPEPPSAELRLKVFNDNWMNIDDADLVLAVTDDFDSGTMWECGYSYARHVPIITHTGRNFGCNLMLAHSVVGHTKTIEAVRDVLEICKPGLSFDSSVDEYGVAIAEVQHKYKSEFSLKEGPDERRQ